jgi:DNA processing protein
MQISELSYESQIFPDLLREIPSAPKQLNILGEIDGGQCVAIVGSRRPTPYGEQITYQLASELAKAGITIVSGLALGIDGIAHQAALDAGGRTVAVLAHGLDRMYPARHRNLAKAILSTGGALVSEYDAGTPPLPHNFVQRNRIISGLSDAVIVTEATAKSGSLITANYAIEQNRRVMAVPGNITSLASAGPNNLIKAGALPVTDATDVLTALGFDAHEAVPVSARSAEEATLADLLAAGVSTNAQLIERSGLSASQFANIISLMEITGKVRNLGAGNWVLR